MSAEVRTGGVIEEVAVALAEIGLDVLKKVGSGQRSIRSALEWLTPFGVAASTMKLESSDSSNSSFGALQLADSVV